ncbi:MAG: FeoB-associated Cys-rich membrane protein [Oscillospiraceae bacterium]|nr:FeoB-associated Cys-rich membrane protein [Oscillospiraceae bacterium]
MLGFITAYGGTIAVGLIVLAIVSLIIVNIVKNRRAGKHLCGGDCAHCRSCGKK